MTQTPYDYSTRRGVRPISWEDFHGLCKALAAEVAAWQPELILPVGRGGNYPGTLIAHMLRVEPYPVRISRRVQDTVVHDKPQWLIEPPALVRERRVLIVDEISGSGETIRLVRDRVVAMGASGVRSAVLYAHTWGTEIPDYIGLITDELVLNPWDREIYQDGAFVLHPEYAQALALQGAEPGAAWLIDAPTFTLAKG